MAKNSANSFLRTGQTIEIPSENRIIGDINRFNIAIAGGPGIGKSTLAALLYAKLKIAGYDFDLILEEHRKLKREFGSYESPSDRFYMWRQQEREEIRSNAPHGFITDTPLFQFYASARCYSSGTKKEDTILRELYRMCLELPDDRYKMIVLVEDAYKIIRYKNDTVRTSPQNESEARNRIILNLVEHLWPEKAFRVHGTSEERAKQTFNQVVRLNLLKNRIKQKLKSKV